MKHEDINVRKKCMEFLSKKLSQAPSKLYTFEEVLMNIAKYL